MKSAALIFICLFVVFAGSATEPAPKKKILVVGFSNSYFNSNAYQKIAKINNASEDSLFLLINNKLLESFNENLNSNFEFTSVQDIKKLSIKSSFPIHYLMPETEKEITSVEVSQYDLKKLGEYYNADIILFVNSYELNWEEDPYLAYLHILDCEAYTKYGEKISAERVSFMMDDVKLKEKYNGKLTKQLSRVIKKLEKVKVENNALVNK